MDLAADCEVRLVAKDMVAHYSTTQWCLCSRDSFVYRFDYETESMQLLFRLPVKGEGFVNFLKDKLARSWLGRKLRRPAGIWHLVYRPNGDILVIYDRIYIYRSNQTSGIADVVLQPENIAGYAVPLRGGFDVDTTTGTIYFGEYLNGQHDNIRIFSIDPVTSKLQQRYQFARSQIKHIHAIRFDVYRKRLWITTGDTDEECSFYYTDDQFATVHRFAGGDQSWRAISLIFDATGMEWGMDAGKNMPASDINKVYRYNFATSERTERIEIGNPAYFSCNASDSTAFLATTYEPGCLQPVPAQTALWFRDEFANWRQLLALDFAEQKQYGVGRYGLLLMPQGTTPARTLLFTPVNVVRGHYHMYRLRINRASDV
ncbi:MAG: hypothetical protein KKE30_17370 [Gammaproteobacteria bacterium]|nr:hypothetical protein [Gammaproteobacteria bacterium]